ncbi:NADPH-dependent FMN reductase [Brevibacterium casei]
MTDHDAQRIFCIVGSLRSQSNNRRLLHEAMDVVPAQHLCDENQGLKAVPPFDADDESAVPGEVDEMCSLIAAADAVLVATPEYNGSVPGQLKNAVDWASRPFATSVLRGKPCAVIGASPGPGGARSAVCDLQRILERSGADVIADTVCIPEPRSSSTGATVCPTRACAGTSPPYSNRSSPQRGVQRTGTRSNHPNEKRRSS